MSCLPNWIILFQTAGILSSQYPPWHTACPLYLVHTLENIERKIFQPKETEKYHTLGQLGPSPLHESSVFEKKNQDRGPSQQHRG